MKWKVKEKMLMKDKKEKKIENPKILLFVKSRKLGYNS